MLEGDWFACGGTCPGLFGNILCSCPHFTELLSQWKLLHQDRILNRQQPEDVGLGSLPGQLEAGRGGKQEARRIATLDSVDLGMWAALSGRAPAGSECTLCVWVPPGGREAETSVLCKVPCRAPRLGGFPGMLCFISVFSSVLNLMEQEGWTCWMQCAYWTPYLMQQDLGRHPADILPTQKEDGGAPECQHGASVSCASGSGPGRTVDFSSLPVALRKHAQ